MGALRSCCGLTAALLLTGAADARGAQTAPSAAEPQVVVVGASLAGLSASIDLARSGARVLVLDMNSVFGGHGIQTGGVAVIGSPLQEAAGFHDTPELAWRDWSAWTTDPNEEWTRYYIGHSRTDIYDFLTAIGVTFDRVAASHGNSIPRFHMTHRRGLNLVRPLFREALRYPDVTFRWNTEATRLIVENGRIAGVQATDLRTHEELTIRVPAVVLATGGFQRNLAKSREHWPKDVPVPPKLLTGSGKFSLGIGLDMAEAAGAAVYRVDRQYNSYAAIPDPRDPSGTLGLGGGNPLAIWVNAAGKRFVDPRGFDRDVYRKVLAQPGSTYWAIFDSQTKGSFRVGAADWADRPQLATQVLENPDLTKTAGTLAELAALAHLPAAALEETVRRYNAAVATGRDPELESFGQGESKDPQATKDQRVAIATPPFYAVQFFPMAHKNMGGVAIDMRARVLDKKHQPIPGLYAGGEITGSAGINGMAGLDGTFTGPSILIGRIAGQSAAAQVIGNSPLRATQSAAAQSTAAPAPPWSPTMTAAQLEQLLATSRDGYWHFEQVHRSVLRREWPCNECHSALVPQAPARDSATLRALSETCDRCHTAPISR
jgi:predicted oxidoreductase